MAPDPLEEGLGVGVVLMLELVLERKVIEVRLGRVLVEERVVVVVVSEIDDEISIEDEPSEELGGIAAETVLVGEMHVGVPVESRSHVYPPAGDKIS